MQGLGSLGSVYYKLPEQFVKKIREAQNLKDEVELEGEILA
jgi:hypothetical protein